MRASVITTCYNAQECIAKTIESVLSQSYRDFEYIIMDGGSTDKTLEIAREYEKAFSDAGIPYHIYSQKDVGIYDGMNHGVQKALGEYVNFMNADDEFFGPEVLSEIFLKYEGKAHLELPDVVYGDAAELEFGELYYFKKNFDGIKSRMPFSHQSVFAKRELLNKYPFNLNYRIAADYDFLMNCYNAGCTFADSGVLICRVSMDGVSSVRLYDTFTETESMLNSHGIYRYSKVQLMCKRITLSIKQAGMYILPDSVKKIIRSAQRKHRGQARHVQA